MSVVYLENFESYALASALTDVPPNYVTTGSSGAWTVVSAFGGQGGGNGTTASWSHAMYNGTSYTYTDLSVKCSFAAGRANIFARITGLSGVNSIPTDGYQLQCLSGTLTLFRGGYVTNLGSWAGSPADGTNFVLRLLCNGTSIKAYVDGTERISVVDATYASGKIGIGTFVTTGALFDNVTVDNGVIVNDGGGGFTMMMNSHGMSRRRRRKF